MPDAPSYVVLVDGHLDVHKAKTASSLIRYRPQEVSSVLDREHAGSTLQEVLGFGGDRPVVATLGEALEHRPNRLLVGIAAPGGLLPPDWRPLLLEALGAGLDVYHGLHVRLSRDPEMASRAEGTGARIVDLRGVPEDLSTPDGSRREVRIPVILTVGSDCNVGKMTAMVELERQAAAAGQRYAFAATGQTGVLLAGGGIAVDAVVSDFVAGAAERLTVEAAARGDLVLVEGQGSLIHPFFSGVTLGLLHGCQPDAMILCHVEGRPHVRHCPEVPIPSLPDLVEMYETAAAWIRPAPIVGVALATHHLKEEPAKEALQRAAEETGLPVEDPVRFPNGLLLEACEQVRRRHR